MSRSMDSLTTTSKSSIKQMHCDYIDIQPQNCLQFLYTQCQTTAVLQINISEEAPLGATYSYSIKGTNKKDYIIYDPSGSIDSPKKIFVYFYLKSSAILNKILKDKFLVEVIEHSKNGMNKLVFVKKLIVKIQSALYKKNLEPNSVKNNKSVNILSEYSLRFLIDSQQAKLRSEIQHHQRTMTQKKQSLYASPQTRLSIEEKKLGTISKNSDQSVIQSKKIIKDINNTSNNQKCNNSFQYSLLDLQYTQNMSKKMKDQLNELIQEVQSKKRKVLILQNQNKSIKARARFRLYITIFIVITALFLGIFVKKIDLQQKIIEVLYKAQSKINQEPQNIVQTFEYPKIFPNETYFQEDMQ